MQEPHADDRPLVGVGLKLISSVSFASMIACVKASTEHVSSPLVVLVRGAVMVAVLLPVMRWQRVPFLGSRPWLIQLRCLTGTAALHLYFFAVGRVPLGETVVLVNTSPLFVPLLGAIFLGERPTPWIFLLQAVGFAGVVLVAGPRLETRDPGLFAAAASGIFVAIGLLILRKLARREHPLTVVFNFSVWTLLSPLVLPWMWTEPPGDLAAAWLPLVFVGLFSIGGQGFLTRAMRFAPAAVIVLLNYFGVALSFLFGLVFWDEVPETQKVVGAALTVGACAMTSLLAPRLVRRAPT